MSGIVGEVEFEFTEDGRGAGKFVPTGKVVGQIMAYIGRGEIKEAAGLYQGCGPEVTQQLFREAKLSSAKLKTGLLEVFVSARDFANAARCAELIDDPRRAAEFFETAYEFGKAGELYKKAGEFAKAALMFEKVLDFANAGRLYLLVGDFPRAAENLERSGDPIGAARLFLKTGNWKRAGAILHGVPPNRGEFFEAGTLLAEILWRTGHHDLAIAKLVEVVRAFPESPSQADLCYRLAEMLAEAGQPDRAGAVYERVEVLKPGFKDVRDRIGEMRRMSQLPAAPAAPVAVPAAATPPPSAPGPLDLDDPQGPGAGFQFVDPDYESLKELPLFAELEREELKELYQLCARVTLPAGQTVLRDGEPGRGLFVVRQGEVEVVKSGAQGEQVLARLGAGDFFGEMSLLEDTPVSATVRTGSDVVLLGVPKDDFVRFLYLHERVAGKVYRTFAVTLSKRLRDTAARASRQ